MNDNIRYFKKINLFFIILFFILSLGYRTHPINSPGNNEGIRRINGQVQAFSNESKVKDKLEVLVTQIVEKLSMCRAKFDQEKKEEISLFGAWYINTLKNEQLLYLRLAINLSIILIGYKIIKYMQDKDGPKNTIPQL